MLGVRKERKIGQTISDPQPAIQYADQSGPPILRALDLLATRATAPKLRPVLTQIRDRVREGSPLSEAVDEAEYSPDVFNGHPRGEKSGNLRGAGLLHRVPARQHRSEEKDPATLVYPTLLVTVGDHRDYLVTAVIRSLPCCTRFGGATSGPTKFLVTVR